MIKTLTLRKFKSFAGEAQTIPFGPVTIFVGANGSGKSNALDALRFLHGIGENRFFADVFEGSKGSDSADEPGIRGGISDACWMGATDFSIETTATVVGKVDFVEATNQPLHRERANTEQTLRHFICCTRRSSLELIDEYLDVVIPGGVDHRLFELSGKGSFGLPDREAELEMMTVQYQGESLGLSPVIADEFSSLLRPMAMLPVNRDRQWFNAILEAYRNLMFYDFHPRTMRDYAFISNSRLREHGDNLSAAVFHLCEDVSAKYRLVEWLSTLTMPPVSLIRFETTKHGGVMLEVEEESGNRIVSARSLSDGTLRFAGFITALMTAPRGAVLLFEEIETGLHPTRVHLLVELFEQLAEERGIQIVATTHSTRVLAALSRPAVENVVVFTRSEKYAGTRVMRLGDVPHFDDVIGETGVDELFASGWMEFATT